MKPGELDPHASASTVAFDLEAALERWRSALLADGLPPSALAELEDHAREHHADLAGRGLSAEEAWHLAARRLGSGQALALEYAKVDARVPSSLVWMMIGYLAMADADSFVGLAGGVAYDLTRMAWAMCLVQLLACAGVLWLVAKAGLVWMAYPARGIALLGGLWLTLLGARVGQPAYEVGRAHLYAVLSGAAFFPLVALVGTAALVLRQRRARQFLTD